MLGIGPKRIARVQTAWEEQKQIREVMVFLQGHGVRASWAVKMYKAFGDKALDVVQEDPYRLAREITGDRVQDGGPDRAQPGAAS